MDEFNGLPVPLDLTFDVSSLIAGLIFGIVGYIAFRRGRRFSNRSLVWIGVALMVYPYLVEGAVLNWTFGFVLSGSAYYFWEA